MKAEQKIFESKQDGKNSFLPVPHYKVQLQTLEIKSVSTKEFWKVYREESRKARDPRAKRTEEQQSA